ncbi:Glutathione S-transferase [Macleaya cordata]|uniref:Glutathione S-transferase n=1 Tax=Macleaya cordata TaxID=56857 RepID=A0A200QSE6_MACCD|nr:Glutathione S-transferase [Macleaya cordata]
MEEEVKGVKLYGMWASIFAKRVEMALKMKGIPYEYVEEDLVNKSEKLLNYNPVYKKVPVLVHHEKPISESLIILEYIDENWKHPPLLLPEVPFQRAKVRFWANFVNQQVFPSVRAIHVLEGEEQEKVTQELYEKLKVLEEGVEKDFFSSVAGTVFCGGATAGLIDILLWSIFGLHEAAEEACGVKIIDPQSNRLLFKLVTSLNDLPVAKEVLPPHEGFVAILKHIRAKALQSPKA